VWPSPSRSARPSSRCTNGSQRWTPAAKLRDGAEVAEITGLLDGDYLAGYPAGTRLVVCRERPHPGAQLDLFDTIAGYRHQVLATDTGAGGGSIRYLEARHRGHARVEDRIRCGKDSGFGRFPSRLFAINAAWLELALTGIDLLAWTQLLLLDGELAVAEPQEAALPAAARRGPDHPQRPAHPPAYRRVLALGRRPRRRIHPPGRPAPTSHLTTHSPARGTNLHASPTGLSTRAPRRHPASGRAIDVPPQHPTPTSPATRSTIATQDLDERRRLTPNQN